LASALFGIAHWRLAHLSKSFPPDQVELLLRCCDRSKGAHLLRHSVATKMLRRGAFLGEIGQLLRHRQPTTTQIYAKVDIKALRGIAPPWMGGAS
jgi:site-specific recombinase XerD